MLSRVSSSAPTTKASDKMNNIFGHELMSRMPLVVAVPKCLQNMDLCINSEYHI